MLRFMELFIGPQLSFFNTVFEGTQCFRENAIHAVCIDFPHSFWLEYSHFLDPDLNTHGHTYLVFISGTITALEPVAVNV